MKPTARGRARSRSRGRGRPDPSISSRSSQTTPGGSQYSCFQSHWLIPSILHTHTHTLSLMGKGTDSIHRAILNDYHIHNSCDQCISMSFDIIIHDFWISIDFFYDYTFFLTRTSHWDSESRLQERPDQKSQQMHT